jgi:myosin heavy subunit
MMTSGVLNTGYDEVQVQLSPTVAKDSTDALAKEMYDVFFDASVGSINEYTMARVGGDGLRSKR